MTHPGGRPTLYKPEYCQVVIDEMKQGNSIFNVAVKLDVGKTTLYAWAKEHPEFQNALKKGRDYSVAWWDKYSKENIDNKDVNAAVLIYSLKTRGQWRERDETFLDVHIDGDTIEEQIKNLASKMLNNEISIEKAGRAINIMKIVSDVDATKKLDELYNMMKAHANS